MIRYICDNCATPFDEPLRRHYVEHLGDFSHRYTEELCPVCGFDSFSEAEECPRCGGVKRTNEIICPACRKALKRRFTAFADFLTAEEEAQLDDWLDGDTVENRRNWK